MVDFKHLLKRPADEIKKPAALPAGDYPGVIKSFEFGDNNKNKTPYVRFHVGLMGWPDDVDESDRRSDGKPIDLAKKPMSRDYFLTDDALWRLTTLIESTGTALTGRELEELIPEMVGQHVLVSVTQYMRKDNDIGHQIGEMVGSGA